MMNKKKAFKILCLFDYKAATGFGTVSHHIIHSLEQHFGKRFYADIIAVNYFGESYVTDSGRMSIHPASKVDGKKDAFGRHQFLTFLKMYDYDGIFIVNDPGVILPFTQIVPGEKFSLLEGIKQEKRKANRKIFKSIFYFPADGPVPDDHFNGIDFFDVIVAYTEYARNLLYEKMPKLKGSGKVQVIWHGVDTSIFDRMLLEQQSAFRKAYFSGNDHKIIVGSVNRNQPRKNIPATMVAFKLFLQTYPDSLLYLHMHPEDPLGWKLRPVAKQLGLVEGRHIMFPPEDLLETAPPPGYLACIYNAMDMFVTTTSGEGFGLTILEAMACGVPVVAPEHTSIKEFAYDKINGDDRIFGEPIDEDVLYATHFDNMLRYMSDPVQVSMLMCDVMKNQTVTERVVEDAYQFAQGLDWNIINRKWIELFEKIFG